MSFNDALSIGVMGMRAHGKAMTTISNNIANVSTVGFKRSETRFSDLVTPETGKTASGKGVSGKGVVARDQNFIGKSGQIATTGRELDVAISGRGFFRVTKSLEGDAPTTGIQPGTLYTRAGAFAMTETESGKYLTTQEGYFVHGWEVDPDTAEVSGTPGPMRFSRYGIMPQEATSTVRLVGYLPADGTVLEAPVTFLAYAQDTLPEDAAGQDAAIGSPGADGSITIPALPDPASTTYAYTLQWNGTGWELHDPANALVGALTVSGDSIQPLTHNGFTFDFSAMEFSGTGTNGVSASADGYARGRLTGYITDRDGNVVEQFDNGQRRARYKLALYNVVNEDLMKPVGDSYFTANISRLTPSLADPLRTGAFVEAVDGDSHNVTASIVSEALEGSNVDLAQEMTNLIVAQRNYQAISKTVTTADQMLQTLVQMA
ncbi:MAG: flagellar hook-basal body complex protein [Rhodospirillaceae bacterium]|nr:flagellar hook-basal body complex protein [Rhodospirillaceae bacterium]